MPRHSVWEDEYDKPLPARLGYDDDACDSLGQPSCCPGEYHLADCPILTGPSNVYYGNDPYYEDYPPEGME